MNMIQVFHIFAKLFLGILYNFVLPYIEKSIYGFPGGSVVKDTPAKQMMWVRSLGRKDPLKRKCQPTTVFFLKNLMDKGAWWATVHGVAKLDTTEHRHYSN